MKHPLPKPPKKVSTIGFRTTEDTERAVAEAAWKDRRSISQWVEGVVLDALNKAVVKGKKNV